MFKQAGELRNRVAIEEEKATGTDSRGKPVKSWEPLIEVWAKIETSGGQQVQIARQLVPAATHVVSIRYMAGLSPKRNRLKFGDRIFNVDHIINVEERNVCLELVCTEQV